MNENDLPLRGAWIETDLDALLKQFAHNPYFNRCKDNTHAGC